MKKTVACQLKKHEAYSEVFKPLFYRLSGAEDRKKFDFIVQETAVFIFDTLGSQLEELIKIKNPKHNFSREDLARAIIEHTKGIPIEEYGVWVYYPWSLKMVHIVDEEEFVVLRTSRNQYKITCEEQAVLRQKRIGIVGLSVGHSVALTLAMERGFGELRLADFDTLELTNLNRIRTGIHNLGLSKVILVAREIAEIDPFLKIRCYTEGLNRANMAGFFTDKGKLHLLIDECDSIEIKIACREFAKKEQIPVVMEASDRGTLDVERFDLEPGRPLLHGLIEHLDISKAHHLSNEEKIPFLIPMIGLDTMSARLKASLLEVGQSITTWPQLGSAVVLGGALVADVCRRIFLNQFNASGRYFIDLEKLAGNSTGKPLPLENLKSIAPSQLTNERMLSLVKSCVDPPDRGQLDLDKSTLYALVEAAILAPSGGNSQPWKWLYKDKILYLFYDNASSGWLDFKGLASHVALGASVENLVLKAHAFNLEVRFTSFINEGKNALTGAFEFYKGINNTPAELLESHVCDALENQIALRHTHRKLDTRKKIAPGVLNNLQSICQTVTGADLQFLEDATSMEELGALLGKIDRMRILDKQGHAGIVNEFCWSLEEVLQRRDGIDLNSFDFTPSEFAGLKLAKDWEAVENLSKWSLGSAFEKQTVKSVAGAAAIGLITMPCLSRVNFFYAGRAMQRIWLMANRHGVSFQPLSTAVFLFSRLEYRDEDALSSGMREVLPEMRKKILQLFSADFHRCETFIFRLSISEAPVIRSLRRPVEAVLCSSFSTK